jgi:hypothetical protein
MDFMNSLDFIKMEKFTGFRVSDSMVLARELAEPGKHDIGYTTVPVRYSSQDQANLKVNFFIQCPLPGSGPSLFCR